MGEIITINPDATLASTGLTVVGASAHAATSDSSDATYIDLKEVNDEVHISFANYTIPANKKVLWARIGMRAAIIDPGLGYSFNYTTKLENGNTADAYFYSGVFLQWFLNLIQTAYSDLNPTIGGGFAGGGGWVQADVNAISNYLKIVTNSGSNLTLRIYKMWVELGVISVPSLTNISPVGSGHSKRPTIAWTYNGSGEPQRRSSVYVFTRAVAEAGGFDLTTAIAAGTYVWWNGAPLDSSPFQTVGTDLTPGTEYVAFVAVSKDYAGSDYWSLGAEAAKFTRGPVFKINANPTVTVDAPVTPVTNTNRPTIGAVYADAENNPMTGFQMRVFTAAQYGIGGFDPATSPATFDTGVVSGDPRDGTGRFTSKVEATLANGTYRAYMRVQQSMDSSWSAWSFYTFVINITAPLVPGINVTPSEALGRNRIQVSRNAGGVQPEWYIIERSDDGGVTWAPIRATPVMLAFVGSTVYTHDDYEAPVNSALVSYRATVFEQTLGDVIASPAASTSGLIVNKRVWLKDVDVPADNVQYPVEEAWITRTTPKLRTVHRPIGRTLPVSIAGIGGGETFLMTFVLIGATKYAGLMKLLDKNKVLFVQSSKTSWYADITNVDVNEHLWDELRGEPEGGAWRVSVSFQEVEAP